MRFLKVVVLAFFAAVLTLPVALSQRAQGADGSVVAHVTSGGQTFSIVGQGGTIVVKGQNDTEAPQGFDNLGNGLVGDDVHTSVDRASFEDRETIAIGLGPVYNAQSCAECHQSPVTGAVSQVTELRAGHLDSGGNFVNPNATVIDDNGQTVTIPNRSLINNRSICPGIDATQLGSDGTGFNHPNANTQEVVPDGENIRAFRSSLNVLGDGFVEAVDSGVLATIPQVQAALTNGQIRGQAIQVAVFEANNQLRVGRFGWKDQQASLLSFSSDAYLNEMGITNEFNPTDVTPVCDTVNDPEDTPSATPDPVTGTNLRDIDRFARFMRATKAPSRDTINAAESSAQQGQQIFGQIGCAICHIPQLATLSPGATINGGTFTIPNALGNKQFHPYSDFLLHNVGTGDGIVQNGGASSRNKVRTAPLWGLRTHGRFMHDLESLTLSDAILRHSGEASRVIDEFRELSPGQKASVIAFLKTL
ncbi:MAG TPA: di-heme oxidoredictase family protein [Blastocatellia bacterium]|nr:di-heme oxidoredictase family protein [Blastocatellia bacterium]